MTGLSNIAIFVAFVCFVRFVVVCSFCCFVVVLFVCFVVLFVLFVLLLFCRILQHCGKPNSSKLTSGDEPLLLLNSLSDFFLIALHCNKSAHTIPSDIRVGLGSATASFKDLERVAEESSRTNLAHFAKVLTYIVAYGYSSSNQQSAHFKFCCIEHGIA